MKEGRLILPKLLPRGGLSLHRCGPAHTGRGGPDGHGADSCGRETRGQGRGRGGLALCTPQEAPSRTAPTLLVMGHAGQVRGQTAVRSGQLCSHFPQNCKQQESCGLY